MQRTCAFVLIGLCLLVPSLTSSHAEDTEMVPVTIDSPDTCASVDKISANVVYLKSAAGNCSTAGVAKARVMVNKGIKDIDIYVDGALWKRQKAVPFEVGDISVVMSNAKKASENVQLQKNQYDTAALAKAEELNQYYRTDAFQTKVRDEENRLKNEMFGTSVTSYYPEASSRLKTAKLGPNERVYIFISSSMPLETVRNYVKAVSSLKDPNIQLVMRGFIGGMRYVKPTMVFIKKLLLEDESCNPLKVSCATYRAPIIIDPMLFSRYGIKKVPAIVYSSSVSLMDSRMSEGLTSNADSAGHLLLYGDVSLDYAIEQILKEAKSAGLQKVLSAYRNSFYN